MELMKASNAENEEVTFLTEILNMLSMADSHGVYPIEKIRMKIEKRINELNG